MRFVKLENFLNYVLPEVPGCPVYTALDRLRWAAIEFCKETGVSVETTNEIDIEANEELLQLPRPGGDVRVWQLLSADTTDGYQFDLHRVSNDIVRFDPIPDKDLDAALSVRCSYLPTSDAERVDEVLFEEWLEAIVSGALSKLLNMSKEDWYDPAEARERRDWFAIAQSEARALAHKNFEAPAQSVQMNPMA